MTKLSELIARLIKALVAAIAAIFGGAKEAAGLLAEDGRQIGRAVRTVGETAARIVGKGLSGPARVLDAAAGAVGATLGALLPRGTVGPQQVADSAVDHDDRGYEMPPATRAALTETAMAGNRVLYAAAARAQGDHALAQSHDEDLPAHVTAWLDSLTPRQIATVAAMTCFTIQAHIEGRSLTAGLPPVPAQSKPVTGRAEMQHALAEIRRIARTERAADVERATGGSRWPALPADDEADYAPAGGVRPAFH